MKLNYALNFRDKGLLHKTLLYMRITAILLLVGTLQLSAKGVSQNLTLSEKNASLEHVFLKIKEQTGFQFWVESGLMEQASAVTVHVKNVPVKSVLDFCLRNQGLTYSIIDQVIIIKKKRPEVEVPAALVPILPDSLKGRVLDAATKMPVAGAIVSVTGTRKSVTTDTQGRFVVAAPKGAVLTVSFIGFKSKELIVSGVFETILLEEDVKKMEDVTISTGMFSRNKKSFTGATSTFSGAELKAVGNLNVLQSLKTLDPAFIIEPNTQYGSNPNRLPDIELRGKTSISSDAVRDEFTASPNQPLFILNGMESTLQQIIDLDINRIESITILKDAASTALYGSKAANGVIVVETIRPKGGALRINYSNDTRWEIADLSGYEMMNSFELLKFQQLAGLYSNQNSMGFNYLRDDDKLYNQRLEQAQTGVNTFWLSVPLRQSLTMGHSLNLNGGADAWTYNVGLNYRSLKGIMIGSDRKTWGGSIDLGYRKKNLNITNRLYINGTTSNESPYGAFKDYVSLAPYYKKQDENGNPNYNRYLEEYIPTNVVGETILRVTNPLYNATLNNLNRTNQLTALNQLNVIWDLSNSWRLSAAAQINKDFIKTNIFIPAEHTSFETVAVTQKGQYTHQSRERLGYQSNVMLTYNQVLNSVHSLTGNIRGSLEENDIEGLQTVATGFPYAVKPNPAFAYSYQPDSKPLYTTLTTRQVSALGSFNYAYSGKYFADATYRIDGSTVFGSARKYSPFWSAGIGWQINKEAFLAGVRWIDLLRVRATTGVSGNQQLGSFSSASVYGLENNRNVYGQGYYLNALGNENLEWQNTRTTNLGLDLALWKNAVSATINVYEKVTDPLIVAGMAPPSSGVASFPLNVGQLRYKGLEFNVRGFVINNVQKRINWNIGVTGRLYNSKYKGFGQILKNLNDAAEKLAGDIRVEGVSSTNNAVYGPLQMSAALTRYMDGYSPDDLWAVRSAGIDPASGREVFIDLNGIKTFTYDPKDVVAVGNARPAIEGVISSYVNIKDFQVAVSLRYSVRHDMLNTALYQKVENITRRELHGNFDKRALDLRWKQTGDQSSFKGIGVDASSPMSSRFIQSESYISGESVNISYQLRAASHPWIKKYGLTNVRFTVYTNDIFRLTNVTIERGTDYPFTRAVAGSIALFF